MRDAAHAAFDCTANATCQADRQRAAGISVATTCRHVHDACVVGEQIVLQGAGRAREAQDLAQTFRFLWRDFVWGYRLALPAERGTFSSLDALPKRYCALNSTLFRSSELQCRAVKARRSPTGESYCCVGDADEHDAHDHWVEVDPQATRAAVDTASVSEDFHVVRTRL